MTNLGHAVTGPQGRWQPVAVRQRRPVRAAVLALVTVSVYGFWWWRDVNRQLKALGQPADPGRALAAVTIGGLALVPPFLSVHRTTTMIAAAQRRAGLTRAINPSAAVTIAAVAGAGAITWVAMAFPAVSFGTFIGIAWPLIAMAFIGYVQRELNRAIGHRAPAAS